MAGHPLRSATDRRFGRPLPHQLPNQTRAHPIPSRLFTQNHAISCAYAVLAVISNCYPPVWGRLPTRYSPVRHSVNSASIRKLPQNRFVRLACVKHAASVHPEPGSNSHVQSLSLQDLLVFPALLCLVRILSYRSEFSQIQGRPNPALLFGIFRVLHTVRSLIFKVRCLFCCRCSQRQLV